MLPLCQCGGWQLLAMICGHAFGTPTAIVVSVKSCWKRTAFFPLALYILVATVPRATTCTGHACLGISRKGQCKTNRFDLFILNYLSTFVQKGLGLHMCDSIFRQWFYVVISSKRMSILWACVITLDLNSSFRIQI